MSWKVLLAQIQSYYPRGLRGSADVCDEAMLCIHVLQQWRALSDAGVEEALEEMASMRLSARLNGLDAIADECTILSLRRLRERRGLAAKTLEVSRALFACKGQALYEGTILYAKITQLTS